LDIYEEALSSLETRDEGLLQELIKIHDDKPVSKEPELKLKAERAKRTAIANFEVQGVVVHLSSLLGAHLRPWHTNQCA